LPSRFHIVHKLGLWGKKSVRIRDSQIKQSCHVLSFTVQSSPVQSSPYPVQHGPNEFSSMSTFPQDMSANTNMYRYYPSNPVMQQAETATERTAIHTHTHTLHCDAAGSGSLAFRSSSSKPVKTTESVSLGMNLRSAEGTSSSSCKVRARSPGFGK
jgi:hypothetical protein